MIKNIDEKISDALGLTQNIKEELLDPKPLVLRPDDTLDHADTDYKYSRETSTASLSEGRTQ